jgi:hypothetical protein
MAGKKVLCSKQFRFENSKSNRRFKNGSKFNDNFCLQLKRSIPLCVINKISEMFSASNTTCIILKFKLGYMF